MTQLKKTFFKSILLLFVVCWSASAQKDYKLWMQYNKITDADLTAEYLSNIKGIVSHGNSETIKIASAELQLGLGEMLGKKFENKAMTGGDHTIIIGSKESLDLEIQKEIGNFDQINTEGFIIKSISLKNKKQILITGKSDIGVLYGVYRFLRLMQTNKPIRDVNIVDSPKINLRVLNHWDNLDRTVERGYAGFSLWNWQKLPDFIDERYIDYARANASIGINGTVLTNVNANALILQTRPG